MSNSSISNRNSSEAHGNASASFERNFAVYIGVSIGAGVCICVIIIIIIGCYKRGKCRNIHGRSRGNSTRKLFVRGFSTVSQRGAIDSTAEFEIVNMSVSSDDGYGRSARGGSTSSKAELAPKKPERRRPRTSSSNVRYENVSLDPQTGGVVRKSVSMASGIPYIDSTLESRLSEKEDELDDVFES
ncbi:hypothetical protein ACF0H5_012497 [Mactra antiquata]